MPFWFENSTPYLFHTQQTATFETLLLGLEVVKQNAALLRLFTPVLDDDARAVNNLASIALTVDLAYFPEKRKKT